MRLVQVELRVEEQLPYQPQMIGCVALARVLQEVLLRVGEPRRSQPFLNACLRTHYLVKATKAIEQSDKSQKKAAVCHRIEVLFA